MSNRTVDVCDRSDTLQRVTTQAKRETSDILILVSVAPVTPYPQLFRTGPAVTWMRDTVEGVTVVPYQALPPSRWGRQVGDLRELLRFPGVGPESVGTVDRSGSLVRAYGFLQDQAKAARETSGHLVRSLGQGAQKSLISASRIVQTTDRLILSAWKNQYRRAVTWNDPYLRVARQATIANSMAIQLDLLHVLTRGPKFRGALFVTASAYVDQRRLKSWVEARGEGPVVGGGDALGGAGPGGSLFSGFSQYLSWDVMQMMVEDCTFDHSVPNDVAITRWLTRRRLAWSDPGIEWNTSLLERGKCPLCTDPHISIVRCTSHGDRGREAHFMKLLHHAHADG